MATQAQVLRRPGAWVAHGLGDISLTVPAVGFALWQVALPLVILLLFSFRGGSPGQPGAWTLDLDEAAANAFIDADQAKAKAEYEAAVDAANKKVADEKSTTGAQAKANAQAASDVAKPLAVSDPAKDRCMLEVVGATQLCPWRACGRTWT